jgi:hypothetical protein
VALVPLAGKAALSPVAATAASGWPQTLLGYPVVWTPAVPGPDKTVAFGPMDVPTFLTELVSRNADAIRETRREIIEEAAEELGRPVPPQAEVSR